jgi:predicted aldo/keto reductase-like oxidoreductase
LDTLGKLRENVAAAVDKSNLSALETQSLEHYAAATRHYTCDGCDHICGAHVDKPVRIGDTMRFLMYHDVYGEKDKARRLFKELPAEAKQLKGVDFERATRACPHGVNIAYHMKRAGKILA